MAVELGEAIDDGVNARVHRLAALVRRELASQVREVVPTYRSLLLLFDPLEIEREQLQRRTERLLARLPPGRAPRKARVVRVPVCYGGEFGPDLDFLARHTGLTPDRVVELHASATYRIHMLGFTPGFPYLAGMPPALKAPRLDEPRARIPAGTVGIAGGQTGIYPLESPGGWRLVGRTPLRVFDPTSPKPFLFSAGDRLRFEPVSPEEFRRIEARPARARPPAQGRGAGELRSVSVMKPGLLTTVQDEGRHGYRAFGVPVAGAMDRLSFALANLLAGNPPGTAALEMTLLGAALRFEHPAYVALCGADMGPKLDGVPVANGSAFKVSAGSELSLGPAITGCRTYLAIQGGIEVPEVLGSRSTYTRAGLGGLAGRALRAGDTLSLSPARTPPPPARALPAGFFSATGREVRLRALLGPQDDLFLGEGLSTLFASTYEVSNRNDRMGYQLEGPAIQHRTGPDIVSDALCPGAIQVPGRGTPIVMMADCQTTGGYAKVATVIGPDLARLAQARRGDSVRFAACSQEEALEALRAERDLFARASAWLGESGRGPRRG